MDLTVSQQHLIKAIDRIAYHGTCDTDALVTLGAIRRLTKGEAPSVVLKLDPDSMQTYPHRVVANLRRTIKRHEFEKEMLEQEILELRQQKDELEKRLISIQTDSPFRQSHADTKAEGSFTYDEVSAIFREKLGKHAGGMKMWADYSESLFRADPDRNVVTEGRQNSWRRSNAFPAWAVQQLRDMPVQHRSKHRWSQEDINFLRDLHLADPQKSDDQLAAECSAKFGVLININSIKGKFVLLRRLGEIPPYRPRRS